ncbi:conserved protein of unknown function [Pseudomonas marincola]|uniref:Uncharacterized protein n=1 Tax=Pseudomonas marincola TaxID=437900 RepID=A0A653DXM4_9PSED|nr:hypothetical protein [Pseudomonas marincola]CAE6931205.1 conserved protein of unknown function [Pseudomonas marincola]
MLRFEIAFAGQLVPGADPVKVKANLAKLFQADEQRIALLFSGRRIVIKTGLDAATAEKYRATIERAGAVVEVAEVAATEQGAAVRSAAGVPVAGNPAAGTPAPESPGSEPPAEAAPQTAQIASAADTPQTTAASGKRLLPRDEYMAAFSEVDAPDFDIAPVGADLLEEKTEVAELPLDLSEFSLAPVGSDMGQQKAPPAAPAPDTSHIKLQP